MPRLRIVANAEETNLQEKRDTELNEYRNREIIAEVCHQPMCYPLQQDRSAEPTRYGSTTVS